MGACAALLRTVLRRGGRDDRRDAAMRYRKLTRRIRRYNAAADRYAARRRTRTTDGLTGTE
ncbi:hypothetical protein [Mycolicibacterium iranicum]|nr:hypothetical protein [Mycolicibacterium iranicum]